MNVTFIKSTLYTSYILLSTEPGFFLGGGGGGGALFEGGCLFQILSLRRGVNSKRGAYLKLGANSSINSTFLLFINVVG